MSEIPQYGDLGRLLPFKCKEGNVTISTGRPVGGKVDVPIFESPLEVGDWVKLSAAWEVEKCAAGDTEAIGQVFSEPEWEGNQPTSSKTWGNYTPRRATIDTMARAVRTVTLESANTAVSVGDSVKFGASTAQTFDKASTKNDTRAITSALANTGAQVAVLFGFYGLLTVS